MKIDIFSGFLGSGKTTLIKKLVKEAYNGEKVVLIENEFGEIGIDGGFLKDAGIEITEMNSGCICCSLVGDFAKALKKVTEEFHPDRIVIEPSGVGKLSDVAAAVEKGLDGIQINSKTTVINAKKCLMYAKNFGEFFLDQLENADCVVLSHTDVATQAKIEEALAYVKEHNDHATVVATPIDELNGKDILSAMERSTASALEMAKEMLKEHEEHNDEHHHEHHHDEDEECCCGHHHHHDEDEDEDEHEHHHEHHYDENGVCSCGHHHHHADEVFASWGKETTVSYTKEELEKILACLENEEQFGLVLRAKGIVKGEDGWIHFDYIPDGIDVRSGSADVIGKICVIGSKINEEALAKLFKLN